MHAFRSFRTFSASFARECQHRFKVCSSDRRLPYSYRRQQCWRNACWAMKSISSSIRILFDTSQISKAMKKRSERRKHRILRAGCSKAEPKIISPPQTPFPGTQDGENLISWRWSLPLPTVCWRSMHAISSYRGNRPTHKPTDRTDYNTLRRS